METIKKFLNPGKEQEDQVLYGSGENTVTPGTQPSQTHGPGSQVVGQDVTGKDPRSSTTDPDLVSGHGTGEGRHLGTDRPSGPTGLEAPYLSSGQRGVPDETSTTASILSGVPGKDQSSSSTRPSGTNDVLDINKPLPREPTGAGLTNPNSSGLTNPNSSGLTNPNSSGLTNPNSSGLTNPNSSSATPHTSNLAGDVDPRVDSDLDRSRGIGHDNTIGSGLTGNTLPDRTVGSSEYGTHPQTTDSSVGRDAALGAGLGAGVGAGTAAVLHHKRDQDDLRSASGLAGTSDTSVPPPSSGLSGTASGTTTGPHSSSLANRADPRVDSNLDESATAGPHASSLANKADPRVDSDLDGSRTVGSAGFTSGTGPTAAAIPQGRSERDTHIGSGSETGVLPVGQTSTAGHGPESWKHEHVSRGHKFAGDPCHDDAVEGRPLFTKGPHTTDTANLLDPHVAPQLGLPSESAATSSNRESGLSAPIGDSHGREVPDLGSTTYGGDGQSRGVPELQSTTYGGDGQSRGVPEFGSATPSGPHHVREAPEIGSAAQSDPYHVRESAASEQAGYGDKHHGRDAALVGGLGAAGAAAAYSSSRDDTPAAQHHGRETTLSESSGHGDKHHGRDAALAGGLGATGAAAAHSSSRHDTPAAEHHDREANISEPASQSDKHHGRDAALAGGLGVAGAAAAYSSSRDDTPATEHTSSTTGPHKSKLLNKLDPRVHPSSTSSERPATTAETSALIGSSGPGSRSHMPTSEEVGASHDRSRDASGGPGLAGAAGATGIAGATGVASAADYESEKRPKNYEPAATATSTSTTGIGSSDTAGFNTKGDYSRDATSATTGGLGSHEDETYSGEEKHRGLASRLPGFLGGHKKSKEPTELKENEATVPSATTDPVGTEPEKGPGHHYVRDAGLASAGIGGGLAAYEAQKIHSRDESVTTSTEPSTYPPTSHEDGGRGAGTSTGRDLAPASGVVGTGPAESERGSDHHHVRDAGLASAGIGGGLAAYEVQKIHSRDEPITSSAQPSTYPPTGHEDGGRITDTSTGRDLAPASGAVGTGLGTDDGGEFSKREAERLAEAREKEFQKEQKAIQKEQVKHEKALEKEEKRLEKEEKKHEKEEKKLEKEEKKHEKEERKHEKALEKEEKRLEKEEKKHEKELAKEEKQQHDDGKKHGGILGLFHRDKSDKADETEARDQYPQGSYQGSEVATDVPAAGDGTGVEHETHKHQPNKLHKDPPAGYYESKGYHPPDSTGTTEATHGHEDSTGYQRSTTGDVYPKVPGGTIIDPQTGLPVDLEKGTGEGGTDHGTMPGFHSHEANASGLDRSRDINQL